MSVCFWKRRRTYAVSLLLGLLLAFTLTAEAERMAAFANTCADVRADTVRLHIRAASDSVLDQTIKLRVRDVLAAKAAELCAGAKTEEQAAAALRQNLPLLAHTARLVLAQNGQKQAVAAVLRREFFDTSHYANATLPAGEYDALRITLGGGKGHNWWCCLYPSLCLAASGAHYGQPAENALVAGDYEVRFAVVDWWEKRKDGCAASQKTREAPEA